MITHEIIGDDMQAVVLTLARRRRRARGSGRADVHDRRHRDGREDGRRPARRPEAEVPGRREPVHHLLHGRPRPARRSRSPDRIPARSSTCRSTGQQMLCQRDAFLCAIGDIDFSIAFTKRLGAGFFGGEGFILQKMEGTGDLFIHSGGTIVAVGARAGRAAARRHRLPRRVRPHRRLRHRARRRDQDEPVRRRRPVLRVADRAGPRLAADAAVLAAGRADPPAPTAATART